MMDLKKDFSIEYWKGGVYYCYNKIIPNEYFIHFISKDYIELKVIECNVITGDSEVNFYFKNLYECFDKIAEYEENSKSEH